jgi:hypothetical protein
LVLFHVFRVRIFVEQNGVAMTRHSCQVKAGSLFPATVVWVGIVVLLGAADYANAGLLASCATPNSVTLTWNAPGDGCSGTVTQYDFRYSTAMITEANWASASQVSNEPSPLPAGTLQTLKVTGLTPNTTYYFAAKVSDQVPNWSELSSIVMKRTSSDVTPPAAVSDLVYCPTKPESLDLLRCALCKESGEAAITLVSWGSLPARTEEYYHALIPRA